MNTKIMKIADIVPADYNPRQDLQKGDADYDRPYDSIDAFDLVKPLIVNVRTNTLVSGHQRLKILMEKGVEYTEVIAVDLDEKKEKLLNIAMNRIEGDWNYQKLEEVIREYEASELKVTGFTEQEINSLFAMTEEERKNAMPETEGGVELEFVDEEEMAADKEEDLEAPEIKPCTIYLSFEDKDDAEKWLKAQGIDRKFDKTQNIIIRMEGVNYGTAGN